MSDSVTIENSNGQTFAEVIDVIGVSEIKKSFQQSVKEGSLHKWFKGSKSKDGKPGWVNVVTGGTCASDEKGEGTPKCVSSSKRASMTKAERLSAARRKKKADPGQQAKSGAAKPTYVSTDKPKKKMKESYTVTNADKKGNTPAYQGYKAGKKNVKTGKPMYKAADHMKEDLLASGVFSEHEVTKLLWTEFDESREYSHNPEKYHDSQGRDKKLEMDKPYRKRSRAARMADPERGINSPAFKKFMADRGM